MTLFLNIFVEYYPDICFSWLFDGCKSQKNSFYLSLLINLINLFKIQVLILYI